MRVGENPAKSAGVVPQIKRHRIIMPVYIPSNEGYFAGAAEIFRMSFQSLLSTVDPEHVSITVIDNASVSEVSVILTEALEDGRIDRLIRHAVNRGKDAPISGEILASYEPFITLADADVMFLPGWLAAVEGVFKNWPATGAVSPAAQSSAAYYLADSTWAYGVLRGQLRFGKFVSDDDLRQFAISVGNPELYSSRALKMQFVLSRGGMSALVGGGHFAITLRRQCYEGFRFVPTGQGLGSLGMRQIDGPVDNNGWLRLSTTNAYVLHMGNVPEAWMQKRLAEVCNCRLERLLSPIEGDQLALRRTGSRIPGFVAHAVAFVAKLFARSLTRFVRPSMTVGSDTRESR